MSILVLMVLIQNKSVVNKMKERQRCSDQVNRNRFDLTLTLI